MVNAYMPGSCLSVCEMHGNEKIGFIFSVESTFCEPVCSFQLHSDILMIIFISFHENTIKGVNN
jgi:hypothetical protein